MVNKKYFWLKLQENFFTDKRVKRLRRIENGDTYTVIYLKMLLLSLKDEGHIYFDEIEDDFIEELALELNENDEDVAATVDYLSDKHMLEKVDEHTYYLTELNGMIGSETAAAQRVRRYRAKKESNNVTDEALQCNTNVTPCNKSVTESKSKSKRESKSKSLECREKEDTHTTLLFNSIKEIGATKGLTEIELQGIYRILSAIKKDVTYLKEKIELMGKRGKDVKKDYPYFLQMLREDWTGTPTHKTSRGVSYKTKFHNFSPSDSDQYSEENLKKIMRGKSLKA